MTKFKAKVEDLSTLEIGTSEFANLVRKTPQWIRQLTRDDILTQCSRGKYKLGETLSAYIEYVAGGKAGDEKASYADIKAQHEMLKKEKTELQLQQMRGQLHAADDVRAVMGGMILTAKSKFLSLPTRISPQLEGESAKKIEKILQQEIMDTLQSLADYSPKMFVNDDE